jgi:phospholipid/cholesterol/gamma-HCH transport system ATP-binding protein
MASLVQNLGIDESFDVPMISLRDLRVSFTGREILQWINFDVQRGETLVILGGSGSGKSTLLRTLVGLEKPTSGQVSIRGKNFSAISEVERDEIPQAPRHVLSGGSFFAP